MNNRRIRVGRWPTGSIIRPSSDIADCDPNVRLSTHDHRRDSAGLTYVYPVLSRRAGGLSIGINLNPNNACNWRCIYCQVPDLTRGAAPAIDLARLREELTAFLHDALHGDFFERFQVPMENRIVRDIAISGNGEPTSAAAFTEVVDLIGEVAGHDVLTERIKRVLITNGSLMQRESVQRGLRLWALQGGELWFKLDRATREGMARINSVVCSPEHLASNLAMAASLCPTWIQTCLFALDGHPPEEAELQAYRDFLAEQLRSGVRPRGVLLYGLARPSLQPEAARLSALPADWMDAFADRLRGLGLEVRVSV